MQLSLWVLLDTHTVEVLQQNGFMSVGSSVMQPWLSGPRGLGPFSVERVGIMCGSSGFLPQPGTCTLNHWLSLYPLFGFFGANLLHKRGIISKHAAC